MRSSGIIFAAARHALSALAMLALMSCGANAADLNVAAKFFSEPVTIDRADGKPPAATVRAADGRVLGYAFSSLDVSGSVG